MEQNEKERLRAHYDEPLDQWDRFITKEQDQQFKITLYSLIAMLVSAIIFFAIVLLIIF